MIPAFVLDASVAIKAFIAEPQAEKATTLIRSVERGRTLWVPDLFFVECANILWKYTVRQGYAVETAQSDVAAIAALPLRNVPTRDLVTPALELATRYGITAYDACYIALAQREQITLITADEKLVRRVNASSVCWLGDFAGDEL